MISQRIIKCMALVSLLTFVACDDEQIAPETLLPNLGAIVDPNVGGVNQPNKVFIDLSANQQYEASRNTWDIGFYAGDEFRVILNNSVSTLARPLNKFNMNEVSAADTIGFGAQLDLDAIFSAVFGRIPQWLASASSWTDAPSGDLSKTAIGEISSDDDENKVYIINRGKNPDGTQRGWAKIKVNRASNGYTLQYAAINANSFQEIAITKNNEFDFVYANLDIGITSVTPEKNSWDFVFTVFTDLLPINPTVSIPYSIRDYIVINANQTEVASVNTSAISYENFGIADLSGLEFSSKVNAIGSGWRNVAQPNSNLETGVKTDVFYIVKDSDNNYYKVRFTRLVDPVTGERGNPQFQYNLIEE